MTTRAAALEIIDRWIRSGATGEKRQILFIIWDMIHGDLGYIRHTEITERVTTFLDAGNQENSDLKAIREFIGL